MMVAYRRGLLKPYYDFGIQSMARESMILDMIDSELAAEIIEKSNALRYTIMASHFKPESVVGMAKEASFHMALAASRKEYDNISASELHKLVDHDTYDVVDEFKKLKESGAIEAFAEIAKKKVEEARLANE